MTNQGNTYPKLSEGTLTPAYGRDYSNKAEAITDFREGKDFKGNWPQGSTLCSIRDGMIGELVKIRYNRRTKAVFYTITDSDYMRS